MRPDWPEAHSAYCTMGTGSLCQGYSDQGVALSSHPKLVSSLLMDRAILVALYNMPQRHIYMACDIEWTVPSIFFVNRHYNP
jgi:hypothetical protein